MQTSYGIIQDIVNQKDPYERLWNTAVSFSNYYDKWMNGPILNVNAEIVDEEVCATIFLLQTVYGFKLFHLSLLQCLLEIIGTWTEFTLII